MILSQGRVADRAPQLLPGAMQTAMALASAFSLRTTKVGKPREPADDDWTVSLHDAQSHLREIASAIDHEIRSGTQMVTLVSNTCPVSIASIPVAARHHRDLKVLWIDAHGDFNTPETTNTGYLGGMCLSGACGIWDTGHGGEIDPANVLIVGARDIDADEEKVLRRAGVTVIAPKQANPAYIEEFIGDSQVWIHIDWDVLEPGHIPAEYSIPNGITPDQVRSILSRMDIGKVRGLELAEYAPTGEEDLDRKACDTIVDTVRPLYKRSGHHQTRELGSGLHQNAR